MASASINRVFRAVADPTRRRILDRLRQGDRSVGELQAGFRISQPAISRHLGVLRAARLVQARRDGRSIVYRLNAAPMSEVVDWFAHYTAFWTGRFEELGRLLDEEDE